MVYQHFMLIDSFTVAENATLGMRNRRLDIPAIERELTETQRTLRHARRSQGPNLAAFGRRTAARRDRATAVSGSQNLDLRRADCRADAAGSRVVIATLRSMAAQGFAIIFISHKLDEVLKVADRITILRRGRTVATIDAKETDRAKLARLMVGRCDSRKPAPSFRRAWG